ncbi:EamA family transporter RarD [Pelagimonas varians]|uniref:EamA-like transporter family protein n=1 Tax=Pelagimonas varians TaxID=696760 RepID=A0A238K3A4_9RHOB|nr:EamA family transporter RarD [Pelagimonas varians]PYG30529.1 chloramphenicol-sensitive protein RarD [Pelagimonas varians]SMX37370.1 EamA-like transporter family protein [Pelagimonas varians]
MTSPQDTDSPRGLAFAIAAFLLWGFLPLYLKLVEDIPAVEVVAHRVLWSVPVAGALLIWLGRTADLRDALRNPKMLGMACVTAALISINWGIYVWAISVDRTVDAALGYYINPLFSVFLGAVLLGERLTRTQVMALGLAAVAVLILFVSAARPPWLGLSLTVSFGFYAYFKKSLPIGPNQGFLLEVLILAGPALLYVIWLGGDGYFMASAADTWLLLGCGIVTAVPLLLYANGTKLLRLSSIAILQYIAPTMIFLTGVFVFDEKVDPARMVAFPLIWVALVIYSVPLIRQMRRA